jgi:hypothetical protein
MHVARAIERTRPADAVLMYEPEFASSIARSEVATKPRSCSLSACAVSTARPTIYRAGIAISLRSSSRTERGDP